MAEIIETPLTEVRTSYWVDRGEHGMDVHQTLEAARAAAIKALADFGIETATITKNVDTDLVRLAMKPTANRPRLLLTPATVAAKRAEVLPSNLAWVELFNEANANRNPGPDNIPNLALASMMNENPVFARQAIGLAMKEVAKGAAAYSRDSGYDSRNVLFSLAVAYDWCHDQLTADEKLKLRAHIEGWCDWLLDGKGYHWNAPHGNYAAGHMLGLKAAAESLGSDSPKAPPYRDTWLKKWNEQFIPYLRGPAAGGWLHDGSSYGAGTLFRLMDMLEIHRSATGEDLAPDWMRDGLLCKVHATNPDFKGRTPMGDQSGIKGLSDYDRASFLTYQSVRNSDPLAPIMRWWLQKVTPTASRIWFLRWRDFMYPVVGPSAAPESTFYYAAGAGFASSRTGW